MISYSFKEGRPLTIKKADKADPQKIGEALAEIREKHDGHLKPRATWEACKDKPRHVLFKHFEWSDEECGKHWRDQQARCLIRSITVEDSDGEQRPAYFSITERSGVSYRSYGDVIANADLQMAVLKSAERDLAAFQTRYREIEDVCEVVAEARQRVSRRIEEARPSA